MEKVACTPDGARQNEPTDDEDLSPELFKIKITDAKVGDKTPVKVKEKKVSSSSSTRKRKDPTTNLKQPTLLGFFDRTLEVKKGESTSIGLVSPPSFSSSSSARSSTQVNKEADEVKPEITETPKAYVDSLRKTSTKASLRRKFVQFATTSESPSSAEEAKVQSNVKVTSINQMKKYTKMITLDGKRQIACTFDNCQSTFVYSANQGFANFYVHYREVHGTDLDAPFPCCYCTRRLVNKSSWTRHDKIHHSDKPFDCDEEGCNKRYKYKQNVQFHKKCAHSQPELLPYVCMICEKRFFTEWLLKSHSVAHSTVKDNCCLTCGYRVKRLSNLIRHVRQCHLDETVACPFCSRKYRRQHLARHLRLHERDDFFCSFCESAFYNRNSYIDHLFLPEHIAAYEQTIDSLGIPRCVPIASKAEWHDEMFFEPSDADNSHYEYCENWLKSKNCKNCAHIMDCKAVYLRDKKWVVNGKIKCGQTMGLYAWDFADMTDAEFNLVDQCGLDEDDDDGENFANFGPTFDADDDDDEDEEEEERTATLGPTRKE